LASFNLNKQGDMGEMDETRKKFKTRTRSQASNVAKEVKHEINSASTRSHTGQSKKEEESGLPISALTHKDSSLL